MYVYGGGGEGGRIAAPFLLLFALKNLEIQLMLTEYS